MKTALLIALSTILLINSCLAGNSVSELSKQDTIPYLNQPYYSEDTLYTMQDLRIENHKKATELKSYDKNTKWLAIISVTIGFVLGLGLGVTTR